MNTKIEQLAVQLAGGTNEFTASLLTHYAELAERFGHYIADDNLANLAKSAMKEKLAAARDKGRGRWWREDCSCEKLKGMLVEHACKGDMIDVMNIAAMIWAKELMEKYKKFETPTTAQKETHE